MSLPKKGRIGADAPKQYRKTVQHRERTPRVKLHVCVVNKLGKQNVFVVKIGKLSKIFKTLWVKIHIAH